VPWASGSLSDLIGELLAACGAAMAGRQPLAASLFLAGLVGSLTHCAFMCGPFVLAQAAARLGATPAARMGEWTRLVGAAALPYHLGRLVTYSMLGALAGAAGGLVGGHNWFTWVAAGLLALAGLSFLGYALGGFGLTLPGLGGTGRWISGIAGPLFARPIGWRGFALGLALGFLPCGLIYAGLAAAAASGGALSGALLLGAFALGTVPGLIAVGLLGHLAIARLRAPARRIGAVLMAVNAVVLLWFAGDLIAARF